MRAQLQPLQEPVYRGYTIWRGIASLDEATVHAGRNPSGSNSETWGRGKQFGILNTGRVGFTWYAAANADCAHADAPDRRKQELLRMFAGWHEPVQMLIDATDETGILKNGAYDLAPLKHWGRGRVTLLGDSAHPCTPNLGWGAVSRLRTR